MMEYHCYPLINKKNNNNVERIIIHKRPRKIADFIPNHRLTLA